MVSGTIYCKPPLSLANGVCAAKVVVKFAVFKF